MFGVKVDRTNWLWKRRTLRGSTTALVLLVSLVGAAVGFAAFSTLLAQSDVSGSAADAVNLTLGTWTCTALDAPIGQIDSCVDAGAADGIGVLASFSEAEPGARFQMALPVTNNESEVVCASVSPAVTADGDYDISIQGDVEYAAGASGTTAFRLTANSGLTAGESFAGEAVILDFTKESEGAPGDPIPDNGSCST